MISVLRPAPHRMLVHAIDRAVADDPPFAFVRSVLLQPLDTLSAFAAAAQGALADDHRAMERLRLMIAMAAGPAFELKEQLEDLHQSHTAGDGTPCELGVVDLGALLVVALAAGRVGSRQNMTRQFVDTVLWTALAAMPAEAIVRTLGSGLGPVELRAILGSLWSVRPADARLVAMMRMLLEPCESARWRCLVQLFARVSKLSEKLPWDAALTAPIESISVDAHDTLHVRLAQPPKDSDQSKRAGWPTKSGQLSVVFATVHSAPVEVNADVNNGEIALPIPAAQRAGWIGLVTKKSLEAAVSARAELKAAWQNADASPCLRDSSVPIHSIADRSILPQRTETNSWGVRIVDLSVLTEQGDEPRAGRPALVEVLLSGAKQARVEITCGDRPLKVDVMLPYAHADIPAELVRGTLRIGARVFAGTSDRPDDERELVLTVGRSVPPAIASHQPPVTAPAAAVSNAASDTSEESSKVEAVTVNASGTARPIVLVRPALILRDQFDRVSARHAENLAYEHALNRKPLPWLNDEELVFDAAIDDPTAPAIDQMFELLEEIAARTSGLEDASWVALLPSSGDKRNVFARRDSEVARELVVASVNQLARLFEQDPEPGFVPTQRLRITGRIESEGIQLTQPPRVELRAAGPGASEVSDFLAVGIDAFGRDVVSRRVRTVDRGRGGQFSLLLPITDSVVAVEFRQEPELLAIELRSQPRFVNVDLRDAGGVVSGSARLRSLATGPGRVLPVISRPLGEAKFPLFAYDDESRTLRWQYRHDRGVRPRYVVEVKAPSEGREIWRRLENLDGDAESAELALDRLGPDLEFDAVRLVASDGFAAIDRAEAADMPSQSDWGVQIRIRRAGHLRYWADLLDIGPVRWSLLDANSGSAPKFEDGPLVVVPEEFIGRTLIARVTIDAEGESYEYEDRLVITRD